MAFKRILDLVCQRKLYNNIKYLKKLSFLKFDVVLHRSNVLMVAKKI